MPKETWDKLRIEYLVKWGWETLKAELGFEHWSEVPPDLLLAWLEENDIVKYLPNCYRGIE